MLVSCAAPGLAVSVTVFHAYIVCDRFVARGRAGEPPRARPAGPRARTGTQPWITARGACGCAALFVEIYVVHVVVDFVFHMTTVESTALLLPDYLPTIAHPPARIATGQFSHATRKRTAPRVLWQVLSGLPCWTMLSTGPKYDGCAI